MGKKGRNNNTGNRHQEPEPVVQNFGDINLGQNRETISACLIVKNEEALLPRCLTSIKDLADEIIVVDTGSEDRTVDIANEFDCRVFHYSWKGDFAAARNESLKYATGDWIFIVDADEELPRGEASVIRHAMNFPDHKIISISVFNKSLNTGKVSSFLPSVRLFRRHLGLEYQGIVHNRLALPPDIPVVRCEARLYHYGYDLSRDKLQQKKARSLELLEKQLQENPDDIFANFNMAQLLRGMDGTADEKTCRKITLHAKRVIDNPDDTSTGYAGYRLMAHIQAATALCTLGEYNDAEKYCRDALNIRPDYIDAVMTLANISLAAQKTALAGEYYRRYLTLVDEYKPENETADVILHYLDARHVAWYGLATIARIEGNSDRALTCYRKVLEEENEYLDTHCCLGMIYLEKGESRRAEEMFIREIEINNDSRLAYFGLGQALAAQGKPDHSVPHLEKAIELNPENAKIRLYLGQVLIETGRIGEGTAGIVEATKMALDDPVCHFEGGNLLFGAGEIEKARACYQKALEIRQDYADAINNLGNCHFRLEDYESAVVSYSQLIQEHPDYWPAYRNLGLAQARMGNPKTALESLMKYAETNQGDIDIFPVMGDLFASLGYANEAIGCYEKYLKNHPGDTSCLLNLAEMYFHLGHRAAAEMGYRQVLAADPTCQLARDRLNQESEPEEVV